MLIASNFIIISEKNILRVMETGVEKTRIEKRCLLGSSKPDSFYDVMGRSWN